MTTNASTNRQKEVAEKFASLVQKDELELEFDGGKVTVTQDGEPLLQSAAYARAEELADELANGDGEAEASSPSDGESQEGSDDVTESKGLRSGGKSEAAKKQAEEEAQAKEAQGDRLEQELFQHINDVAANISDEEAGELRKNSARYYKGRTLMKISEVAERLSELGVSDAYRNRAAVNRFVKEQAANVLAELNEDIADPAYTDKLVRTALSRQEINYTRKAYRHFIHDFAEQHGDLEDTPTFELEGVNVNGEKVTHESVPVEDIALMKLYYLSDFVNPTNRDVVLSFAHLMPEKIVQQAKKLMGPQKNNAKIIKKIWKQIEKAQGVPDDEDTEDASTVVENMVNEALGIKPTEKTERIPLPASVYNLLVPVRSIATDISRFAGLPVGDDGQIAWSRLMEILVVNFFSPDRDPENARGNILQAFIDAGEGYGITTEQAESYIRHLEGAPSVQDTDAAIEEEIEDEGGDEEEDDPFSEDVAAVLSE